MSNLLPVSSSGGVSRRLTFQEFQTLLSPHCWKYILWTVRQTRSYEAGLDAALLLLEAADEFKPLLQREDYESKMQTLYHLHLSCLDRLDRWEEYLDLWDLIRQSSPYELTYVKSALKTHGERIKPFILREDARYLYVHFLYSGSWRRHLIVRKVERKRSGKKIGNLLHHPQSALSIEEIENRLGWLKRCYEASRTHPG